MRRYKVLLVWERGPKLRTNVVWVGADNPDDACHVALSQAAPGAYVVLLRDFGARV